VAQVPVKLADEEVLYHGGAHVRPVPAGVDVVDGERVPLVVEQGADTEVEVTRDAGAVQRDVGGVVHGDVEGLQVDLVRRRRLRSGSGHEREREEQGEREHTVHQRWHVDPPGPRHYFIDAAIEQWSGEDAGPRPAAGIR
jgi:hypothetical protein